MQTLTRILESRSNFDSQALLQSEVTSFIRKVNKKLPKNVQDAIFLTSKYNLMDKESIEEIRSASKSSLPNLAKKYNIPADSIETLWVVLKDLRTNIKLLPQYMSEVERKSLELGKLATDDLTIDLETPAGRNAAAKMYTPLVYTIVKQFEGKSRLSRQDLISAGLLGLSQAINNWERENDEGKNRVTFKTYAGYTIRQQILQDMTRLGHTFTTNNWAVKNADKFTLDAISFDDMARDEDGYLKIDHIASLGAEDKPIRPEGHESSRWEEFYKLIDDKFPRRHVDLFCRYFGIRGYKKESAREIAKSMGISENNLRNTYINKILAFVRKDRRALEILGDLQDIYAESLMAEMIGFEREQILEKLANDDMFLLLEELNQWRSKDVFLSALKNALSADRLDDTYIRNTLSGTFEDLDASFKKNRKTIISFLSGMYPTENMSRKTDVALLDYMSELQSTYQRHKITKI